MVHHNSGGKEDDSLRFSVPVDKVDALLNKAQYEPGSLLNFYITVLVHDVPEYSFMKKI